ncbi:hypothetical protein VPH35_072287 [Triticum aestivum]
MRGRPCTTTPRADMQDSSIPAFADHVQGRPMRTSKPLGGGRPSAKPRPLESSSSWIPLPGYLSLSPASGTTATLIPRVLFPLSSPSWRSSAVEIVVATFYQLPSCLGFHGDEGQCCRRPPCSS